MPVESNVNAPAPPVVATCRLYAAFTAPLGRGRGRDDGRCVDLGEHANTLECADHRARATGNIAARVALPSRLSMGYTTPKLRPLRTEDKLMEKGPVPAVPVNAIFHRACAIYTPPNGGLVSYGVQHTEMLAVGAARRGVATRDCTVACSPPAARWETARSRCRSTNWSRTRGPSPDSRPRPSVAACGDVHGKSMVPDCGVTKLELRLIGHIHFFGHRVYQSHSGLVPTATVAMECVAPSTTLTLLLGDSRSLVVSALSSGAAEQRAMPLMWWRSVQWHFIDVTVRGLRADCVRPIDAVGPCRH